MAFVTESNATSRDEVQKPTYFLDRGKSPVPTIVLALCQIRENATLRTQAV